MEILRENYTLEEIYDQPFKTVPRGIFKSPNSKLALDYHSGLLSLVKKDNVEIRLYLKNKPDVNKNIYLMRGVVYKIEEDSFECSFGGLLLIYSGPLSDELELDAPIYVSVNRI